ncbi:MAG: hypothetical protein IPF77_11775 [Gemmatimonadetes bacterium]|nr:hypothetical protein [Gemmatimonadota bacterium]
MDRLLLMLRAKSAAFGERIPISRDDYPLLALKGLTEWDFVIVQVRDQGSPRWNQGTPRLSR